MSILCLLAAAAAVSVDCTTLPPASSEISGAALCARIHAAVLCDRPLEARTLLERHPDAERDCGPAILPAEAQLWRLYGWGDPSRLQARIASLPVDADGALASCWWLEALAWQGRWDEAASASAAFDRRYRPTVDVASTTAAPPRRFLCPAQIPVAWQQGDAPAARALCQVLRHEDPERPVAEPWVARTRDAARTPAQTREVADAARAALLCRDAETARRAALAALRDRPDDPWLRGLSALSALAAGEGAAAVRELTLTRQLTGAQDRWVLTDLRQWLEHLMPTLAPETATLARCLAAGLEPGPPRVPPADVCSSLPAGLEPAVGTWFTGEGP